MKRSDWFYIWTAITGYVAGIIAYLVTLKMVWGEQVSSLGQLVTWTAPAFFTVVLLFYFMTVVVLRTLRKYSFWLQTLIFLLVGIIPVMFNPFTFIYGAFGFSFLFSPEGLLFFTAYSSSAVVCSYGAWIAQTRRNKNPFYILSIIVFVLFIMIK